MTALSKLTHYTFTVTFDEPVSGFDVNSITTSGDLDIGNVTYTGSTDQATDSTWEFEAIPIGDGPKVFHIPAAVGVTDQATNANQVCARCPVSLSQTNKV